jgi:hypothetical protein
VPLLVLNLLLAVGLTVTAVYRLYRHRTDPELGVLVQAVLNSFAMSVLMAQGLIPGFAMIAGYALFGTKGSHMDDYLIPGAPVWSLLLSLGSGLVVSTVAAIWAFVRLVR